MRLNYRNDHLFTVGKDGAIFIMEVKDRDPKWEKFPYDDRKKMNYSEEILTEKQEILDFEK